MIIERCALVTITFFLAMTSCPASTLIPVSDHHFEHTFDAVRNRLYIPTQNGTIERYDVASNQLLSPFFVGDDLRGSDITADGDYLYVADNEEREGSPLLHKIDLRSGDSVSLETPNIHLEGLADISIAANGNAFVTSRVDYSPGVIEIMILETQTGRWIHATTADLYRKTVGPAHATRGADRSLISLVSGGTTGAIVQRYEVGSDSYRPSIERISGWSRQGTVAINRNSSLLAIEEKVYQPDSTLVHELPLHQRLIGGLAFDPAQDVLYMADRQSDSVVVFDTDTWEELGRIEVGENLGVSRISPESNYMSTSDDGKLLFVTTASGVRVLGNSFAVPEPAAMPLIIFAVLGHVIHCRMSSRKCRIL